MIHPERIQLLNDRPIQKGTYVLYWMQQAQRAECNHALEYAIRQANELRQPVVVLFGLTDNYPEANERHYAFLLEGLREVRQALRRRKILFVLRHQAPEQAVVAAGADASLVVVDAGYLRIQKHWRTQAAAQLGVRLVQVETDVVVPVDAVSTKEEYAAATLRPRLHRQLEKFLVPLHETPIRHGSLGLSWPGLDLDDVPALLRQLRIDRSVPPVQAFPGGTRAANRALQQFIEHKLRNYAAGRRQPAEDWSSRLSPYLHFGHISPLHIALEVSQARAGDQEDFLEELLVRRELSMNFVHRNPAYDTFDCLPAWAKKTLAEHTGDRRDWLYPLAIWEAAATHEPYWNAAQQEMVRNGFMHNTMRMYWGKKILEWSATPEEAFRTALFLNNKYELDGRDANSFAGVAWIFGKHDRPWGERPVFGKVRYMNAAGLRRKFDMDAYLARVAALG